MTFAKASTAIADRATDLLRSELFVGGFTINKSKKIRPAYLPREVTFTRADDTEETYFLVQSSNDARKVRPLLYPRSIVHNVIVPIAGLTDIPDEWARNVGEVFTVAELAAKCKPAAEALPAKTGSWRIAILPAVFAFPGNEDSGYGGVVDEGCVDFFESIHAHASFWPRHIVDHVPAFQRAVLASYEGDKKVLGKYFPTLARKDCRLFTRTPFVAGAPPTEEEEEEIRAAVTALESALQAIAAPPCNTIDTAEQAPGFDAMSQLTPRTRAGDKSAAGARGASAKPAATRITPKASRIARKPILGNFDDQQVLFARFQLAGVGYDPNTKTVFLPDVDEDVEYAFSAPGGSRGKNLAMASALKDAYEAVADCDDYISRTADPPAHDLATLALLMHGVFDDTPLTDIDLPASAKTMFRAVFMTPDSKYTASQREAATDTRTLEELCGETSTNTSKVKTSILYNTDVFTINEFVVWVCNLVVYFMTTYKVDVTEPDKVENSLLYRSYRDIAMALSSREARQYWKNVPPGPHSHRIFCWLTNVVDTIFRLGTTAVRQPRNALLALTDRVDEISTEHLDALIAFRDEALDRFDKIIHQMEQVPTTHIATNYELRKRKLDEAAADRKAKLARTDAAPRASASAPAKTPPKEEPPKDKSGVIVYKAKAAMPSVPQPNPLARICGAFARDGVACRHPNKCKMIHNPKPERWQPATLSQWCELIESTPDMSWHPSVDMAKVRARVAELGP